MTCFNMGMAAICHCYKRKSTLTSVSRRRTCATRNHSLSIGMNINNDRIRHLHLIHLLRVKIKSKRGHTRYVIFVAVAVLDSCQFLFPTTKIPFFFSHISMTLSPLIVRINGSDFSDRLTPIWWRSSTRLDENMLCTLSFERERDENNIFCIFWSKLTHQFEWLVEKM